MWIKEALPPLVGQLAEISDQHLRLKENHRTIVAEIRTDCALPIRFYIDAVSLMTGAHQGNG